MGWLQMSWDTLGWVTPRSTGCSGLQVLNHSGSWLPFLGFQGVVNSGFKLICAPNIPQSSQMPPCFWCCQSSGVFLDVLSETKKCCGSWVVLIKPPWHSPASQEWLLQWFFGRAEQDERSLVNQNLGQKPIEKCFLQSNGKPAVTWRREENQGTSGTCELRSYPDLGHNEGNPASDW